MSKDEINRLLEEIIKEISSQEEKEVIKERLEEILKILEGDKVSLQLFSLTLSEPSYKIAMQYANELTMGKKLWNRHDIFHAITTLMYALEIYKNLPPEETNDIDLLPVLTLACLWHDATRAIAEEEHEIYTPWLVYTLQEIIGKCIKDRERGSKILLRTLYCISMHSKEEIPSKCMDSSIVRIADGLDIDYMRSSKVADAHFRELLRSGGLTHVWGTLIIKKVYIEKDTKSSKIIINVFIDSDIDQSSKLNWFQVQEILCKKIRSTLKLKRLLRLKIKFRDREWDPIDFTD